MSYTSIQFIGYSIDTAPKRDAQGHETYLGLQNTVLDIEARWTLMQRALATARDNLPAASPPVGPGAVLKVFLAPEFYFRGRDGAYQMDDVQKAIALLQRTAAQDQWSDWVFAFGSIVGVSAPADPAAKKEIYNFVLIQQGGVASQGPDGARIVMKELKSHIDFIAYATHAGGLVLGEVKPLERGAPSGPGRERQRVAYDGAGIYDLYGMTWATDICLDHLEGRLVNSPQLPGERPVQLQLIPSCGADIDPDGVVAAQGGYVFNVDGHNGSHADLRQVGVPPALPPIAPLGSYPVDGGDISVGSPPVTVRIDEIYRSGAGRVVIFPAQAVPVPDPPTVPGTVLALPPWPASADYQFQFELVYGADGALTVPLCQILSRKTNFQNNKYFLPLDMAARDSDGNRVGVQMTLTAGTGGFDRAIWCKIDVPGFMFEGAAVEFHDTLSSPPRPPRTVW